MANPYDAVVAGMAGAPASPQDSNPYDAVVEDLATQQQQRARTVYEKSLAVNPDQAAEAQRLAKQAGLPPDAVERNLEEVRRKEQARALDLYRMAQDSPILARQLADPAFTKQAHDDIGTLEQVGQFFSNTGKSVQAGVYGAGKGAAGVFRAGFELAAPVLDFLEPVTAIGGNPLRRLAEGFAMNAEGSNAAMKAVAPKGEGNIESGYYSGIQSLTQNLLALPMAFMPGGQGASLAMMTSTTGGQSYQDARQQGLSMSQALPYAASQAAIEYATEKLPLGQLIGDVKAGTGILKTLVKQMALEIPGEQIATVLQDMNEWAALPENKDKPFKDYVAERPNAAAQTLVATIVGTGGNVAVVKGIQTALDKLTGTANDVGQAEDGADRLQSALQTAAQSMLRERNPEEFRSLMQRMAENTEGAPQDVYVDAEVLNQLPQEVLQQLPQNVLAQLGDALAAGDVVSIPVADVLTIAPGTALEQTLIENARIGDPMAMTQAEAKVAGEQAQELLTREAQRVIEQANDQVAMQASSDRVKQSIVDQLNTAGRFRPAVNEAYANVVSAFYTTMAARQGISPEELYQRYNLRVGAQGQAGQQVLNAMAEQNALPYQIDHKPMTVDGGASTLDDLTGAFGEDIYGKDALQFFGSGDPREQDVVRILRALRGKPDAKVTIYRGVPAGVTSINPGDWVTLSKEAAEDYASQHDGGQVVSREVPAAHVTGWADSLLEFGYYPPTQGQAGQQVLNAGVTPDLPKNIYQWRNQLWEGVKEGRSFKDEPALWRAMSAGEYEALRSNGRLDPIFTGEGGIYVTDDADRLTASDKGAYGAKEGGVIVKLKSKPTIELPSRTLDFKELGVNEITADDVLGVWDAATGELISGDPNNPNILNQPAYHGTPYRGITQFSTDKIGTGEGAQAYGWGLYFASKRGIAEWYRENLSKTTPAHNTIDGKRITKGLLAKLQQDDDNAVSGFFRSNAGLRAAGIINISKAVNDAIETAQENRDEYQQRLDRHLANPPLASTYTPEDYRRFIASYDKQIAGLNAIKARLGFNKEQKSGQLYEVEIPEDSEMLLWDKPLSEQPEAVRKALEGMGSATTLDEALAGKTIPELLAWVNGIDADNSFDELVDEEPDLTADQLRAIIKESYDGEDMSDYLSSGSFTPDRTGESIYRELSVKGNGDRAASEALLAAGVKGIKYLDGTSRNAGDGSYNYVVFSGDDVAIANQFYQGQQKARGTFNPKTLEIILNENADLSTFLHETGHFFLEVMADIAAQPGAPADIAADMGAVLKWFGVPDLATWQGMSLDQQRKYHERFAESFEQYLLEGKAPSLELQGLFRKFRAWLTNVYRSLKAFVDNTPDEGMVLSDEIRQVFDRMLATEAQIAQAEEVAGLVPDDAATAEAIEKLTARSLRDLKWTVNARGRAIKDLQKEAKALRNEVMIEVRREVMTQPVYRAWAFLKGRLTEEDALPKTEKRKSDPRRVDETQDTMLQAIAKLGGINREQLVSQWGMDKKEKARVDTGFGGKRSVDTPSGMSLDEMGMTLLEYGYLTADENGRYDSQEFEEKFFDGLSGYDHYSISFDYDAVKADEQAEADRGKGLTYLNSGRLDRAMLAGFDKNAVALLEKRGMVRNDAIHPDVVAGIFGFESGQDLVAALAAAEDPKSVIEGMTDQRMLEQHGDLVDQRAIEAAANEAVHNEARARALATELKAQADLLRARRDTGETNAQGRKVTVSVIAEAAKQFAANVIAKTPLKDLKARAWQHVAAERRAGQRWQDATTAGKTEEAVKAKQDQVLNNAAAKAANEAQAEMRKIIEFFRRVVKDGNEKTVEKGRDPDIVNAARAILAAYGVAPRAGKTALEYLEVVQKNDPQLFEMLQPSIQGALNLAQPMDALTMDELRALHEEIQGLWYMAKRSRQMEVDGNLMDLEDAEAQLQERMQEIGVPDVVPGEQRAVTPREALARKLQTAFSILSRVEQWADGMGTKFTQLVFQPVKDAADAYRADRVKYRKKYQALVDQVAPFMPKGKIAAPELGYSFGEGHNGIGMAELLHAVLHTGNDSNRRKLLLGRNWATENADGTLDTSRWDAFLQRMHDSGVLRKEHYDFAQGVWDLLEETKPLAQKAHRDVFGRYFAEVTANEFTTPFGTYRGGYVPAQADPEIVNDAALRELARQENENMSYSFPATNRGFTKGRVEYNRPLKLDLRSIGQHLDKVLLFSHMEPAVRDVNRLLQRKGVSYSLSRIDPTVYQGMLIPWLNRAARQTVEDPTVGDGGLSRIASIARANAGMALMFANVSNTLQQITGFSLAAVKVKPSHMMRAMAQFVAAPKQTAKTVSEASSFMENRMGNEIAAINEAIDDIVLAPGKYAQMQNWAKRHAYFLQSAMANTMEPIIWTAAYNQAIEEGQNERDAVRFADSVIRTTQGSTLPEDVSRAETGKAMVRLLTQFVGYFNMMANTNGAELKKIARDVGLKKGAGKALYIATAGLLIPLWTAEAIAIAMRGGPDDEDDDGYLDDWLIQVLGMGTLKGTFAMVPFVGQLANAAINRFNGNPADDRVSMSPAVSLIEGAAGVPVLIYKAITDPEKINARNAVRDVASAISVVTGLPATAVARPLGYLAGVEDGKIEPTSDLDMARGLVTGSASPESK